MRCPTLNATARYVPEVGELDPQSTAEPTAASARDRQRAETMRLLRQISELPEADPERARLRGIVIEDHMNYARHLARRFARSYDRSPEDFEQVAYVGLVKAVNQFDPERGGFLGYATPTVLGEIKRHFRDGTWAVHVPRGMQELSGAMYKAKDKLRAELGREPSVRELADLLGVGMDEVVSALDAADAYRTSSLDRRVGLDDDAGTLGELIGGDDPGFDRALHHEVLRGLLKNLGERDKRILLLSYFRGLSQAEIGEQLGISQMQVSRLLARIIAELRTGFFDDA